MFFSGFYSIDFDQNPQIAVMILNVKKESNNYYFSIKDFKIINSSKIILNQQTNVSDKLFEIIIFDDRNEIIEIFFIQNPTLISYEYSSDYENIDRENIEYPEADIFVRFTFNSMMQFMRISYFDEHLKRYFSTDLKLPL
jgi:hypothetical protein